MHSFFVTTAKGNEEEHLDVINVCIEDGTLQVLYKSGEVFIYNAHAWYTVFYEKGEDNES